MINDIENKNSLNEMSDLEHDKNQLEMMRYRVNSLSYILGISLSSSFLRPVAEVGKIFFC